MEGVPGPASVRFSTKRPVEPLCVRATGYSRSHVAPKNRLTESAAKRVTATCANRD